MQKKEVKLTDNQKQIWDAIKGLKVEYYALPDQTVETISSPMSIEPECLYLTIKGPAALPAITDAVAGITFVNAFGKKVAKYAVEMRDKYVVITPNK